MSEHLDLQGRSDATIGVRTLAKFLFGDRDAILKIASASPSVLGVGALLVISAALAREYDGADLLAEPWHLAVPLAASLGTSFLLFCLLFGVGKLRGIGAVPFGRSYLRFLAVYWMTAPLAWLYAIPVEQFMTPHGATLSNLALLATVSIWRVWLMIGVAEALIGASPAAACSLVLFFADAVALAAIATIPKPVFSLMGGISHTDSEIATMNAALFIGAIGVVSLPIWLIASISIAVPRENKWHFAPLPCAPRARLTLGIRCFSVASVAIWALILPITQPKQRLARRVDADLEAGRIAEAIRAMADHKQSDFPARWDPPPHIGYGNKTPSIVGVMEAVLAAQAPAWVQAIFTEKFGNTLYDTSLLWPGRNDKEFGRCVKILLRIPEGPSFAARQKSWLQMSYHDQEQSEARRADMKALLDLAETYDPDKHPAEHFARSF